MKKVKNKDTKLEEGNKDKKESFFKKMKTDKKYSAKVQLMGYGILIILLVVYLQFSSSGSNISTGNTIIDDIANGNLSENTEKEKDSLLGKIVDNYSYDMVVEVKIKNADNEEGHEEVLRYKGKSYKNQLEINKEVAGETGLYYKVDNHYYSKLDGVTSFVKSSAVYDVIDGEYIELEGIFKLMDKASLDHLTEYSNGRKEYVYHLNVKDVIVSYAKEDVVEIKVLEENGTLKIDIDYTNLFRVIDDNILECKLEATITQIGEVEEFEVVVSE